MRSLAVGSVRDGSSPPNPAAAQTRDLAPLARLARWPVAVGLLGSTTMVIAGAGTMQTAVGQANLPWFFTMPPIWSAQHRGLLTGLFYLGLGLLTGAWLALGAKLRSGHRPDIHALWWASAIWSIPLVVAPALLSQDLYAYLAEGHQVQAGINPFLHGPGVLGQGPLLHAVFPTWRVSPTLYGPLFLRLVGFVAAISGGNLDLGVMGLRMLAVASVIVVAALIPRLARGLGADPVRATWLVVASPLMLVEFVLGAHNDIIMIALVLVGLALLEAGRPMAALVACALAVMVKDPAAVAVAFVAIAWAYGASGWRKRSIRLGAAAGVVVATMAATSLVAGVGWGWLDLRALSPSVPVASVNLAGMIALVGGSVLHGLGMSVHVAATTGGARLAGIAAVAVFCALVLRRAPVLGWTRSLGLCLVVVSVLGQSIWPWYLAWGFILLAVASPSQRSPGLVVAAALTEFVFGPFMLASGYTGVVIAAVALVLTPYSLRWIVRNLLRPKPAVMESETAPTLAGVGQL